MYIFEFIPKSLKKFQKLDATLQKRISDKISFIKLQKDLSAYMKKVVNKTPITHRIRIWDIRILLKQDSENHFFIVDIWYRWDIYK